jgi:hypothetical protein
MRGASPHPRRRFSWKFYALYCALIFLVVALAAEGALRLHGVRPWEVRAPQLLVEPGGRLYRADPELGYAMLPGRYRVRFASGHSFSVTHDEDGHRLTRPGTLPQPDLRPQVWLLGGSFTYGWAIDDEASFPWQLQELLPELRIESLAVPGYGTLHGLVELRRRVAAGERPAVVVVAYISFHDERNTFVRSRRKRVAPFNSLGPLVQPYARLKGDELVIAMAEVEYREWPGMRGSALVHFAEDRWNAIEAGRARSGQVTLAILEEIGRVARSVDARVLVATLVADARAAEVRRFARAQGFALLEADVDLSRPGFRNTPHDSHPSPRAASEYARRFEGALRALR